METYVKSGDRILLRVKVIPNAKSGIILGIRDGSLTVKVTAPPDKGRANKAVLELLAGELGIRKSALRLETGETSRQKTISLPLDAERALLDCLSRFSG